jgi:hypothetical protein
MFARYLTLILLSLATHSYAVGFNRDVLPILSDRCFNCHGLDAQSRKADLRLDLEASAKAEAIVPGKPAASPLIDRIFSDDPDEVMPPPDSLHALSDREKQTLKQWIAEGAKWEQHWAFVKTERPAFPATQRADWPHNGIDHFILARLEQEGLAPSPEAPRGTLIRRVTLDLTGLPPTPEEVDAFLADEQASAYERLVDRLLESPRYGEHMALPWLEAARFADTDGYQFDGPRFMWRWRDWVIDAYNQHMPFDQFTIEQLAGDLLPDPTLEQQIATGFNRNHRYNSESGLVVEEFLLENAVDRVETTATVWLGLTMGCARCHDHKYDPFTQKDYYQLIAYFNNVPEGGRAIKAGNSEPYILAPTKAQQPKLATHEKGVADTRAALSDESMRAAQREWEKAVADGSYTIDKPLIQRLLAEHYPMDGAIPEGAKVERGSANFAEGPFGQALVCDGETVVAIPNSEKRFTGFGCTDRYSLAFWLRPDKVDGGVIVSRQEGGMARKGTSVELRDGHLVYNVISRWIAGAGQIETVAKLTPDEWVHVTVSCDGSQRATEQRIYINGQRAPVRVRINTNSNTGSAGKNDPLRIGGGPHGPPFTGAIDDFRYYKRELEANEVPGLAERTWVSRIAEIAEVERTPGQAAKIHLWFREHGPEKARYKAYVDALAARNSFARSLPTSMVMVEGPPRDSYVRVRGVYNDYGEKVERGVPEILPPMPDGLPANRLGFAKWLVSGDNPLTARVTVNRYWQRYFGTGIVKTSEDFGVQGEAPSHPDLLDWLATEFVRSGWDVAGMQRLIVTSATYRQAAVSNRELRKRDPENRLLAQGPRFRLPGPVLRDQALAMSGLLVERIGGPSVSPYQPPNLWIEMSMGQKYKQSTGDDLFRRSVYTVWKRTVNPPSMAVLDAADREACWVGVKRTNTPLQALALLNETAFVESARHLGQRMLAEDDPVGFGFRVATASQANAQERAILDAALAEYRSAFKADVAAAKKLITVGTTTASPDADPIELAALTTLANVLLNLDEVLTKE